MFLNYNSESLEKLIDDFFVATGVNFILYDEHFNVLIYNLVKHNRYCDLVHSTDIGKRACRNSDLALLSECKRKCAPVLRRCHAGLIEFAWPVLLENKIIAYIVLGQVKKESNFSSVKDITKHLPIDYTLLEKYYEELNLYDEKKFNSITNLAMILVKYILLENMLVPGYEPTLDRAINYINNNLEFELNITDISISTKIPKSSLYKLFHKHLGCTVNEYINKKRIEKSIELLRTTHLTMSEIAQMVGFSNPQYFSRIFKSINGISPLRFRKQSSIQKNRA